MKNNALFLILTLLACMASSCETENTVDPANNLVKAEYVHMGPIDGELELERTIEFKYNVEGNVLEKKIDGVLSQRFEYDAFGRKTLSLTYHEGEVSGETQYLYPEKNTTVELQLQNNDTSSRRTYRYNNKGWVVYEKNERNTNP